MTNEFLDNAKETLDKIFNLIESKYEKFEVDFEMHFDGRSCREKNKM